MMKKNKYIEPYVDTERWFVTFNDLMTLLLTFFVLLLSMSSLDTKSIITIQQEFISTLGATEKEQSNEKVIIKKNIVIDEFRKKINHYKNTLFPSDVKETDNEEMNAIVKTLNEAFKIPTNYEKGNNFVNQLSNNGSDQLKTVIDKRYYEPGVSIIRDRRGVVIRLPNAILFDQGEILLSENAYPVLDKIASVLNNTKLQIFIEGHTDSMPISTGKYASNWELSVDRAICITEYFIKKHDMLPEKIGVGGYGATVPLVPNSTADNRAKNRRVEIILSQY